MNSVSVPADKASTHGAPGSPRAPGGEVKEVHTRILRLALGVDESRSYWEHMDAALLRVPAAQRAQVAFEQRWFGAKSLERVRFLIASFVDRFDPFPEALVALHRFPAMDVAARHFICHVHLQLTDPMYRRFTGQFLPSRRSTRNGAGVDRDVVLRWVKNEFPDRWSEATCVQFASKLLSAATEAGLVAASSAAKGAPRALLLPKVPDMALAYAMHLLRGIRFEGTLTENPYLASVGLTGDYLDQRLRALPGLAFKRMAHLTEFNWEHATLSDWAAGLS